jgi:transposase
MEVLYTHCCGIDVHKKSVSACVLTPGSGAEPQKQIRHYETTVPELLKLLDWLKECGVTHVAMESTGVYWKPVWNILEGQLEVLLVNAAHIKNVPGRKSDKADCSWIANLLRHGLLQASFVPPEPIRQLRDLCRSRTKLVQQKAAVANRIQKVLEDANLKLASVATDVLGASGRQILKQIIQGPADPQELAGLARGKLRHKREQLEVALVGRVTDHHRFLLKQYLAQVEFLEGQIAVFEAEIQRQMPPFEEAVRLWRTIPGIDEVAAWNLVAEIGAEMDQFPSARHLVSWAGLCPGNHESAGKRLSGKTRPGNPGLRGLMVQVAWAASHTKDTYLAAQYARLARRRGRKRALIALANTILSIAWYLLRHQQPYQDLGVDYFHRLEGATAQRYYIKQLQKMGFRVTLEPLDKAA